MQSDLREGFAYTLCRIHGAVAHRDVICGTAAGTVVVNAIFHLTVDAGNYSFILHIFSPPSAFSLNRGKTTIHGGTNGNFCNR